MAGDYPLAVTIRNVDHIIGSKIAMTRFHKLKAVERALRVITRSTVAIGGKIMLVVGEFRRIPSVMQA